MEFEYATCETTGCGNCMSPIPILRTGGTVMVVCGACGVAVTNIVDIQPVAGKELPAWILEKLQTQNSGN